MIVKTGIPKLEKGLDPSLARELAVLLVIRIILKNWGE